MKTADATSMVQRALEQLAAELERGRSDALVRYLATMSRFHRYSWSNVLLILSQRPDATRVAGFRAWNRLSRYVRRGEKGIVILAPMYVKARGRVEEPPFEPTGSGTPARVLRFKPAYVFDIGQTDGEPLPEIDRISGDPAGHLDRLIAHIESLGITLVRGDPHLDADGVSLGGQIRTRAELGPAEEFGVLVHELAHERLHRGEDRATISRTVRETEAEAVAYVVSQAVGLVTGTACSDYIAMYRGNRKTLAESLARVQAFTHGAIIAAELPVSGHTAS